MINKEIIQIKNELVKSLKPLRIYLFGSYARGTYNKDSDYDICIIMPDDNVERIFALTKEANRVAGQNKTKDTDFFITRESRFNKRAKLPTMEREILKEGIILYEGV